MAMKKKKRSLWISLLAVVIFTVATFAATFAAGWAPKLGLDLNGGLSVVYQTATPVSASELQDIVNILSNRVSGDGTSGATVVSQHTNGQDQISVSIPGETHTQAVLATLGNTAQLLLRPALCYAPYKKTAKHQRAATGTLPTCNPSTQLTATNLAVKQNPGALPPYTYNTNIPEDPQFAPYASSNPTAANYKSSTVLLPYPGLRSRIVLGPAELTGTAIHSASAQLVGGQWAVNVSLTSQGSAQWDKLAQQQFHAIIGIDLDGVCISAPITQAGQTAFSSFAGSVQISGGFTEAQAKQLAVELNYGSLPVKLNRLTVESVSASLGKSSLDAGLLSGLAGLVLVMLYMLVYYRLLGVVVITGLGLTGLLLWMVVAVLGHSFGTTIDLAGVIGIIVSVGITVDSYIVYFERLKDETRSGRSVRASVERGFESAFRTVVAADLVSLLAAVILYKISIGPVQGFALFLGISTVIDIVMTYFFTRPFVVLLGGRTSTSDTSTMGMASGLGAGKGAQK